MSVRRIAKLAKVSPATVSMVLRNSPKIPAATKARVRRIAEQIGYKPDAKVAELMRHLSLSRAPHDQACLGVVSLYEDPRPWEKSLHMRRFYEASTERAATLGYRLEYFWLRAPGMTYRRMRSILDTRGVQGLLCLGSSEIDDEFPPELDHYAIVTQGLSIRTPLHRIVDNAYRDTMRALDRVYRLGYRRPGLVLGRYDDIRSGRALVGAYLAWCEHMLGTPLVVPVLRLDRIEADPLLAWQREHRPDVLVVAHVHERLGDLTEILRRKGPDRLPKQIGVVALSQILRGTGLSGIEENEQLMGEWAVELLVSRVLVRDFGIPEHPRIEMVEGQWVDGKSL